jgi:hypothetical protein
MGRARSFVSGALTSAEQRACPRGRQGPARPCRMIKMRMCICMPVHMHRAACASAWGGPVHLYGVRSRICMHCGRAGAVAQGPPMQCEWIAHVHHRAALASAWGGPVLCMGCVRASACAGVERPVHLHGTNPHLYEMHWRICANSNAGSQGLPMQHQQGAHVHLHAGARA